MVTSRPSSTSSTSATSRAQSHQLGAAERPGKAQEDQGSVPLSAKRIGRCCHHYLDVFRQGRGFVDFGRTDRAANAPEGRLDCLRIRRGGEPRELVKVADRGEAPAQRGRSFPDLGFGGQEGRHGLGGYRKGRRYPLGLAPGHKQSVISLIGPPGSRSLLGPRVAHCRLEVRAKHPGNRRGWLSKDRERGHAKYFR